MFFQLELHCQGPIQVQATKGHRKQGKISSYESDSNTTKELILIFSEHMILTKTLITGLKPFEQNTLTFQPN